MAGVNRATLLGRLGADPDLRYTQSATPVASLSVATNRKYTTSQNEKRDETEWHRVVVWGKQAEHCNKYLTKGREVYIEGRIQTRSYEDKDGIKRYATEIVAETVQFIGGRRDGEAASGGEPPGDDGGHGDNYIPSDPGDDDIPF
jgi:single-strand DNA-binding protein